MKYFEKFLYNWYLISSTSEIIWAMSSDDPNPNLLLNVKMELAFNEKFLDTR